MKQKSGPVKAPAEEVLKAIRRQTRRHYLVEDKIRSVLEGLKEEESIVELTISNRCLEHHLKAAADAARIAINGSSLTLYRHRRLRRRTGGACTMCVSGNCRGVSAGVTSTYRRSPPLTGFPRECPDWRSPLQ